MNLLISKEEERGPLTLTWLLIDRREEGNAVKEGQKCGRSSIWPGFAQPWGSKAA